MVTGVGYGLFGLGTEFFPESMPPGEMVVQIETPVGTRAEVTDEFVRELEQELNGGWWTCRLGVGCFRYR
ncbi:MAG: hypothetical protein CM1200mP14_08360 [Gammaproteobacteria bacterium]|nr:MAG: hypothetical protein CM1200mP14_08360 [Gammaproteobacteria bacterium]